MKKTVLFGSAVVLAMGLTGCGGVDFGDDTGPYTMDRECDDPRFSDVPSTPGGMAGSLDASNIKKDATDCEGFFTAGWIELRE
ncbi:MULTISPECIES: hypothetical protein [Gammaproteobacteria]|uniref:hypothetical protein n=1 Tax=Gammaproteobacteria TaxID=1236 RepID=UPI000DD01261|nr:MULTISPECIES: hypothetical protein [Gammaproteobacteria]RTE85821.1 hypothetical protein DQX04_10250 [Aliidiomarina sp. B3213]TCZ90178.1 hypothetical protein EYQ95_10205 [Lysobacter sp. N42]